ncbi:hypothetical protein CWE13_09455 [Aliidiomarina shirensis]|uniref:DUF2306 domain-containing protein n=1 Tax=Aliidiomarina shirensis TaxID=1048642 RepID=A0A432WQM5_9GAMM|nr:hypothetical protein [Aliidiomarina shirensis]RUO36093.1 hypothetical protein CWE13_09455 [Aliidiomarina shirensis]
MLTIYQTIIAIHVLAGAFALCLFWIPVLARKGSVNHKRFGRIYGTSMHTVAFSGITMSVLVLIFGVTVKPELAAVPHLTAARLEQAYVFAWFLIHLGILIHCAIIHGNQVLEHKKDRSGLKKPVTLAISGALALNGALLGIYGLLNSMILLIAFGALGIVIGVSNLVYIFRKKVSPTAWLREHLGAYLGSGIGAYTAFIVFGGSSIFQATGWLQTALWIAPGVIGSIFVAKLSRKYDPPRKAAAIKVK